MYLYRILPFHHLVELFEKRALSLSSPKTWEDPYEWIIGDRLLDSIFAQCWCTLGVSDAMWRIYSPDRFSVRIKTTRERLENAVAAGLSPSERFKWKMGKVDYKPTSEIETAIDKRQPARTHSPENRALASLFVKRNAFKHESEYRVVVLDRSRAVHQARLLVPMNPHELVLSVLVDPRAHNATVQVFKFFLKEKIHFKGSVAKSVLYERAERA